jgi:hypothetical protein
MTAEEWRSTPNPLYEVSDLGRVRSKSTKGWDGKAGRIAAEWKVVGGRPNKISGYIYVVMAPSRTATTVHSLVCAAFHGPRPDGLQVAHLNGVRDDNRAENLMWASPKENSRHKALHGTQPRGEAAYNAKLTEADVRLMKQLRERGAATACLADIFGITYRHAYKILVEESQWTSVSA